jgi:hypothetical protein
VVGESYGGLSAVPWYGWRSTAEVEALGAAVASRLGCTDPATDLACLRRLPVEELLANAQPFQPYAFGDRAASVQARYPLSASTSPAVALATVLTDRMWARSTFALHRLLACRPGPASTAPSRSRTCSRRPRATAASEPWTSPPSTSSASGRRRRPRHPA